MKTNELMFLLTSMLVALSLIYTVFTNNYDVLFLTALFFFSACLFYSSIGKAESHKDLHRF